MTTWERYVKLKLYLEWSSRGEAPNVSPSEPWKLWSGALAVVAVIAGFLVRYLG